MTKQNLTTEQRELLGLGPGDAAELIADVPPPARPAGNLGYAGALRVVLQDVVEQDLSLFAEPVQGADPHMAAAAVYRHATRPELVLVQLHDAVCTATFGSARSVDEERFVLDASSGGRMRTIAPDGIVRIFTLTGNGRFVAALQTPPDDDTLAGFEQLPATGELQIPSVPPPAAWLGVDVAEPWLLSLVEGLAASRDPLGPLVAAGTFARLWSAPRGAQRFEPLRETPPLRCRAWARTLAPEVVARVEGAAIEDVGLLLENLSDLAEDADAQARTTYIVTLRDDLESLLWVLVQARAGRQLAIALADLDDEAATHGSVWSHVTLAAHPRWNATVVAEPDAWWARLAAERST